MQKNITILLAVSFFCSCTGSQENTAIEKQNSKDTILQVDTLLPKGFKEIKQGNFGLFISMAYADTANFTHTKLYPCAKCLLTHQAAKQLEKAALMANKRSKRLLIYDCYRPFSIQEKMYKLVPDERYVAKPGKASYHNKGAAIDISLCNSEGKPLDMGSRFDEFSEKAKFDYSGCTDEQKRNRMELRTLLMEAGFTPYESEWWHFFIPMKNAAVYNFAIPCE